MDKKYDISRDNVINIKKGEFDLDLRNYMLGIYNYMASGLALTGIVAWLIANTALINVFFSYSNGYVAPNMLVWISMFGSVGMVFYMSWRINTMSFSTLQTVFWTYAVLNGVWLSSIFMTYTSVSIVRVFFITASSFAALSMYGYTTKRNLDAWSSFLYMGLFGIIIGSLVNIFLQSSAMHWIMSVVGVLVFAGLTAYDTQKVRDMYFAGDSSEVAGKKSIMGALTLYLDFINMFIMLLQLFGQQSNRE